MIEPERIDLIGELAAGYPSLVIAEQTIEAYVEDLSDLPLEVLRGTIAVCRRESKYFPTVSEIREKAVRLMPPSGNQKHPDSCKCFGTSMYVPEGRDGNGYSLGARRCDGLNEGFSAAGNLA